MNELVREQILRLEDEMRKHSQLDLPVTHHFAPGVYARELFIPKGTLLTGKIHKTEHLNILAKGKIAISNLGESKEFEAPYIYVSPPGTKRAGYVLEDSVWITIHVTEETDLEKIESEVIAQSFLEFDETLKLEVEK